MRSRWIPWRCVRVQDCNVHTTPCQPDMRRCSILRAILDPRTVWFDIPHTFKTRQDVATRECLTRSKFTNTKEPPFYSPNPQNGGSDSLLLLSEHVLPQVIRWSEQKVSRVRLDDEDLVDRRPPDQRTSSQRSRPRTSGAAAIPRVRRRAPASAEGFGPKMTVGTKLTHSWASTPAVARGEDPHELKAAIKAQAIARPTPPNRPTPLPSNQVPRLGWSSAQAECIPRPCHVDPLAPVYVDPLPSDVLAHTKPTKAFDLDPDWIPYPDDPHSLRHGEYGHDLDEAFRWTSVFRPDPEMTDGTRDGESVKVPVESILQDEMVEPPYWVYISVYISFVILLLFGSARASPPPPPPHFPPNRSFFDKSSERPCPLTLVALRAQSHSRLLWQTVQQEGLCPPHASRRLRRSQLGL